MHSYQFYLPSLNKNQTDYTLDSRESQHLKNVLRFKKDDTIRVFNGRGIIADCRVVGFRKGLACLKAEQIFLKKKAAFLIYLATAIIKFKKLDLIVEKTTEIGVDFIWLYTAQKTKSRTFLKKTENRVSRLEQKVIEAAKQSQQSWFPEIKLFTSLDDIISRTGEFSLCLAADRSGTTFDKLTLPSKDSKILILIGPEVGLTDAEKIKLNRSGFKFVKLSDNLLRSETAAIVSSFLIKQWKVFS
jgi:16S rRNA (uracil1498-N3)-methyltransferase